MSQTILVLDFGGQYKELIARSVRNLGVYSAIYNGNLTIDKVLEINPIGIILTGGPDSVYREGAFGCDKRIFDLGIPILGICYGMHLMCQALGGIVKAGEVGEYGQVNVYPKNNKPFLALMSHRDVVKDIPNGFVVTAKTKNNIAAFECVSKKLYGVQYHPETALTPSGSDIIKDFLYNICKANGDYCLDNYIDNEIKKIRKTVGKKRVLLGLSGGVDSSVCAALLSKAVPDQLTCVFVDHGLMRLNEGDEIERAFKDKRLNFVRINAKNRFLKRLEGVIEPEKKRKIIGEEFVRVFEEESKKLGQIPYLAQGTIYPDIVESGISEGAVIKSHHNVGGLPKEFDFEGIIEPLSGLFKDEVRALGRKLGLKKEFTERQPFPGPGLAIRIMGEITENKVEILQKADKIVREELKNLKKPPDQYFAVLTNTYSVGVKGDDRTYDYVLAVRAVQTDDYMTCTYAPVSHKRLLKISERITNEIAKISRVVYDITGKPPATVEWE